MKKRTALIGLWSCSALVFFWLLVAFLLTGGRDWNAFTERDNYIILGAVIVEVLTVCALLFFTDQCAKANRQELPKPQLPKSGTGKLYYLRGILSAVVAYVVALGIMLLGIVLQKPLLKLPVLLWALFGLGCGVPVFAVIGNFLLSKRYTAKLSGQKITDLQQRILTLRKNAAQEAEKRNQTLRRLRRLTDAYTVFLGVCAVCLAFAAGVLLSVGTAVTFCLISAMLLLCAFSRVRFRVPKALLNEDVAYVSAEEYPHFYALAQRARRAVGCDDREIRIALVQGNNAGIGRIGAVYSLQLGVFLLQYLSEEELYRVLLHEFAHMKYDRFLSNRELTYYNWLAGEGNPNFLTGLIGYMFSFPDQVYFSEFYPYHLAVSVYIEAEADEAMYCCGSAEPAASALKKINASSLFAWEKALCDAPCTLAPENAEKHFLTDMLEGFLAILPKRAGEWERLAELELLARSATHPTLQMRLAAMGAENAPLCAIETSGPYREECKKALDHATAEWFAQWQEGYAQRRKEGYLEPKARIDAWEAAGKPLDAVEYADLCDDLCTLGRVSEAVALCDRAIAELDRFAAAYAHFLRGSYRLHRYDPAGLEDVYRAIEANRNYGEEGFDEIGEFCCLTGRAEDLEQYRERVADFAQKDRDVFSKSSELRKGDALSEERLPEGMLEDILRQIRSFDDGAIEKIYLVRKTIDAEHFASVFVIRFATGTDMTLRQTILHRTFRYLDIIPNRHFALFDFSEVAKVKLETIPNSVVYQSGTGLSAE